MRDERAPPPQLSPDGRFYWGGRRWVPRVDGLSTAALVIGILSLVLCFLELGVVLGPIAIVMGFVSIRRIAATGRMRAGETRASVGLGLGVLGFLVSVFWISALSSGPPIP